MQYSSGNVILDEGRLGTEGGRALSYRDASLTDAALRVALDDMYENVEASLRIRRCDEPDCRRIFFAARRGQSYCSHSCANRTASRKYRESHGAERARRERERYERKTRERTGFAVKIGRRSKSRPT
jgi:hypothetical protein